ncbi:MAG: PQQ-binding-like beta-propeller repeat protein [Thermoleophilia bacterium]
MGTKLNSAPSVVEGLVYFGSDDGNLYAFDGHTGIERL